MINFDPVNHPILCKSAKEMIEKFLQEKPTPAQTMQYTEILYDFLQAKKEDHFLFYSSLEHAIESLLLHKYFEESLKTGKNHFITAETEDAAILLTLKTLEEAGCFVKMIASKKDGTLDEKALQKAIGPKTALCTFSLANPLTGVIQNLESVLKIAKNARVPVHIDVTHALGKIPFSFKDSGVDYLTFSAEALHGPKSAAALFISEACEDFPRAPAKDFSLFAGFVESCRQASLFLDQIGMESSRLRHLLEEKIEGTVLFEESLRLPHITAIAFSGVWFEALYDRLKERFLLTSFGGGKTQPLSRIAGRNDALSFTLSRYTTEEDIEKAAKIIAEECQILRSFSKGLL